MRERRGKNMCLSSAFKLRSTRDEMGRGVGKYGYNRASFHSLGKLYSPFSSPSKYPYGGNIVHQKPNNMVKDKVTQTVLSICFPSSSCALPFSDYNGFDWVKEIA